MKKKQTTYINPELAKSKGNILKNVFGVCFIWFMIFIFTFYMDGETGIILACFALFSMILSYFTAYYARNRIKISAECQEYIKKGNELTVKVKVEKKGRFPLAFVDIYTFSEGSFGKSEQHHRISLTFEKSMTFEYKINADFGGNGKTGIRNVYSSGFFGFASYLADVPEISRNIGVIPEIPEVNSSNSLFRAVNDIVVTSDDEETDSPLAFSANAMAGYEHRDYIEGDSLRRINWKLSSKRNKLMVRLDEASASVQPVIFIDLSSLYDTENAIRMAEKNICSAISLITLFVKQGISCKVHFKTETDTLRTFTAESEESVNDILMNMIITPPEKITPLDESIFHIEKACAYIIFSVYPLASLIESDFAVSNKENVYFIISNTENIGAFSTVLWYLGENNNFEKV